MTPQALKNSILQLAIQGKLVEQREAEGRARELIKKIKAEKDQLIKEGKIKKEKPLPEITEAEIPFEIPESWEWVRLGEVVSYNIGKTPPRGEDKYWGNDFNWVSIADMIPNGYINKTKETISSIALKERFNLKLVPKGTLLMSFKLTIGRVSILNIEAVHNEAIISIYPYGDSNRIIRDYLFAILPMISIYGEAKGAIKGRTLNSDSINSLPIPLPPLAEQERIVAKIEELMPYVEQYGEAYSKLEELNKKFPADMQKSILQYAIQGKLVEQREAEGSAEKLFQEIQKEKARLLKEGKIKKEKPLPEITEAEIPFEIPESWEWVRLGEVGSWSAGSTPSRSQPEYYNGNIPWLKTGDLNDSLINSVSEHISEIALEKTSVRLNPIGSVLMAMYGATIGKLGILNIEATTNQACCACITYKAVYNKYLFYYLLGQRTAFIKMGAGGAQPNISKEKITTFLCPLPPLAEQVRIVAKIEELLPYCRQLVK